MLPTLAHAAQVHSLMAHAAQVHSPMAPATHAAHAGPAGHAAPAAPAAPAWRGAPVNNAQAIASRRGPTVFALLNAGT